MNQRVPSWKEKSLTDWPLTYCMGSFWFHLEGKSIQWKFVYWQYRWGCDLVFNNLRELTRSREAYSNEVNCKPTCRWRMYFNLIKQDDPACWNSVAFGACLTSRRLKLLIVGRGSASQGRQRAPDATSGSRTSPQDPERHQWGGYLVSFLYLWARIKFLFLVTKWEEAQASSPP